MVNLNEYLQRLSLLYSNQTYDELYSLISFDQHASLPFELSQSLKASTQLRPTSYTSTIRSFYQDPAANRPLIDFLSTYLLYLRDATLSPMDEIDFDEVEDNYRLLQDCFKQADKLFASTDSSWFVPVLRTLTKSLVDTALLSGKLSQDPKFTKAGEAARLLSRPMGVAASDRSPEVPSKRDALFFLVNSTFLIYFSMKNLRLCDTILSNTSNAVGNHFDLERYSKSDRCTFHYYRGRIYLYQRRLGYARNELRKSLELCWIENWGNTRLILIYLIVASLPLGINPSSALLQEYDLDDQFEALLLGLTKGNFELVLQELDRHKSWHLSKGNYLLLKEKLELICWRNLCRQTLLITTQGNPLPPSGPPTLPLKALLLTSRSAFNDESLDLDDVENMCTSLIDQGYLKAYILHSKRLLVLQKSATFGFPPLHLVNAV